MLQPSNRTERAMDEAIRKTIQAILDGQRIMSVATLRPDGWPQATTVGYGNDGLSLYFLCGPDSQKAANLARDPRLSLTIDHDTPQMMEITGLTLGDMRNALMTRPKPKRPCACSSVNIPSRRRYLCQ